MTNTVNADSQAPTAIASLDTVLADYPAVFCDVWGVLHNGESVFRDAEAALAGARRAGLKVVLLTNAPRPSGSVVAQLDRLGVDHRAYDSVVTSGDVTRQLIASVEGAVHHIGPERDIDLFEGLSTPRVGIHEASAVLVSGLVDDESETPDDYRDQLERCRERDLPLICANPDLVVHRGSRLIYCAGALAKAYADIGGSVTFAGKPHAPIYETARRVLGLRPDTRALAIGDGMPTDIRGANDNGFDALFITGGIHQGEFGRPQPSMADVGRGLAARELTARYAMAALQ